MPRNNTWKSWRRRLALNTPRMIVRSRLPWPIRWAVIGVVLGASAGLALWAFDFGRSLAGQGQTSQETRREIDEMRQQISQLKNQRDQAQTVSNTADSLIKTEQTTRDLLAQQLKALEEENLALKADLAFFEQLLPTDHDASTEGLSIRGFEAKKLSADELTVQLLIMQPGRSVTAFDGRYELVLSGTNNGQAWSSTFKDADQTLSFKQYQRVTKVVKYPSSVVVQEVAVKVIDRHNGRVRLSRTVSVSS